MLLQQALVPAPVPAEVSVLVGSAVEYRIREIPIPKAPGGPQENETYIVYVNGKPVQIPGRPDVEYYDWIYKVVPGRDGSFLVRRKFHSEPTRVHDLIRIGDEETLLVEDRELVKVTHYFDAKNYIGWYYPDSGLMAPMTPPTTLVVANGVRRKIGFGQPIFRWGDDRLLVTIPVDRDNRPTPYEFWEDNFLRLYQKEKPSDIGRFGFVGATEDRRLVLRRNNLVAEWRDGKIVSLRRLPKNWEAVATSPGADILVRERVAANANDTEEERDWRMGILCGDRISPVVFARPKGSEKLCWRETGRIDRARRIRIDVFFQDIDKRYELTPRFAPATARRDDGRAPLPTARRSRP